MCAVCVAEDNEVCNSECTDDGCWGPLEDQCISCRNFRLGKRCLETCESLPGVYTSGPTECQRCHPECLDNCNGPVCTCLCLVQSISVCLSVSFCAFTSSLPVLLCCFYLVLYSLCCCLFVSVCVYLCLSVSVSICLCVCLSLCLWFSLFVAVVSSVHDHQCH